MHHNNKIIGLVGGVGPWASLDVHRKILEQATFSKEQDCVSVMHLSFPGKYSDRTDYLLGKTNVNPAHAFIKELRLLEQQGANCASIICNTAHAAPIWNVIEQELQTSSLNYVSIIHETQRAVEQDAHRKVGLLATLGTYELDLYKKGFNAELIYPSKINQARVHDIIYNQQFGLKSTASKNLSFLYQELTEVASKLVAAGAEALILGCTELPLLYDFQRYIPVKVYDPNQLVAAALVRNTQDIASYHTIQNTPSILKQYI